MMQDTCSSIFFLLCSCVCACHRITVDGKMAFPCVIRGALRRVNYIITVEMDLHLLGHYSCSVLGRPARRLRIRHTQAKWPC